MGSSLIFEAVTDFDWSSSVIGFMYKGKKRYKSFFGGFSTLAALVLIIAITILYLVKFINRNDVQIIYHENKFTRPPRLDLSKDFYIAIITQYNGMNIFRNDILNITAMYKSRHDDVYEEKPIQLFNCKKTDFPSNDSVFQILEIEKALCLNLKDIEIEGGYVNRIFDSVQVKFSLFDDFDEEIISSIFEQNKPLALIYFFDTVYALDNTSSRVENYVNYVDVNVTYNNAKRTNILFSKNELIEKKDFIISSHTSRYSNYVIDSYKDYVSARTKNEKELLQINLLSSKKKQIINISYTSF